MDAEDRLAFVFGSSVDPASWNAADLADRRRLVEKRFGDHS
jgi:hypothetical protein